jgi:aspartate/methionine/tyrosine aminotransferase
MIQITIPEIKRIESIVRSSDEYISFSQGALKTGGVPVSIKKHMQELLSSDVTDYYQSAWGVSQLRKKLAEQLSQKHKISLSVKNVIITHGCIGALTSLFFTILERGDDVLIPEPTYPAYKNLTKICRCNPIMVPYIEENNPPYWNIDIEKIKAAATDKTKILVFSNPCNPLGTIVPKEILIELKNWCEKKGIYLIVDESYDNFIFDDNDFDSATPMVAESDFVIRTGSFSKSLSMSGWRVGFMVLPESISTNTGITQDALINCPNVFAQHGVLYALNNPECSKHLHDSVLDARNTVVSSLDELRNKGYIEYHTPPASFYLFIKTMSEDSFDLCTDILNTVKVGLIPGRAFGESGKPFVRLCYARTESVIEEGTNRIINYFSKKTYV